jgi:hypothetical protein
MFINTLWYENVDDYDFSYIGKCSSIEDVFGLNGFLII